MAEPISIIVGLGNPGPKYDQTRHNAGFWFVDALAQRSSGQLRADAKFHGEVGKVQIGARACWLLKPSTFMNRSGQAVRALAQFHKVAPESILVVHDELDLSPGVAKLKQGGGHGGHNGLRDTIAHMGKEFARLRLGIGHPGHRDQVVDYVLHRPSKEDEQAIETAIYDALDVVDLLSEGDFQAAMNALHRAR